MKWTWCCVHHCVSHRLDDLNELMPLISECCNPVTFSDTNNLLTSVDPTILPCCVPQLFDFVELQEDIIHFFVAGKSLLQSPQKIRIPFNFKEQSKPQQLPGNMWVHTEQCHVMNKGTTHYLWLYWQTSRCCISDGLTWQKTTWIWVSGYQFCCYYTLLYMHKTWCPACLSVYSRNIHRP